MGRANRVTRSSNSKESGYAHVSTAARRRGRRLWVYRIVTATVAPLLILLLLEGGLRLFSYGHDTAFFIRVRDRSWVQTNPRFGWRFFSPTLARWSEPAWIEDKPPQTFRIFVLGGSAAMGVPDAAFSFGRILRIMLEHRYPDTRFEVINAAMTAINSHVVRQIAADCARMQPDLFIVYLGNNEIVGPYGPGTVFAGFSRRLGSIRASIWMRGTRVGQLMGNVASGVLRRNEAVGRWRGMELFTDDQVAAGDPRLEDVYAHLLANLEDVCRIGTGAGARVLLSTVAVNLRDCPPFASVHHTSLGDDARRRWQTAFDEGVRLKAASRAGEAIEQFRRALEIDDGHAELHYRAARCLEAIGDDPAARDHYGRARDLDALRFRADGRINRVIRETAARMDAVFVDAERAFERSAAVGGIPGNGLFYEHVHMTFAGNHALAAAIYKEMASILPQSARRGGDDAGSPVDRATCARLLALTDGNRHSMAVTISQMMDRAPFTAQLDHEAHRAQRKRALDEVTVRDVKEFMEKAVAPWTARLAADERDVQARFKLAVLEQRLGRHDAAITHLRRLIDRIEDHPNFHRRLGAVLGEAGRYEESMEQFERALAVTPTDASLYHGMGVVAWARGNLQAAEDYFIRAMRLDPEFVEARLSLSDLMEASGDDDRALVVLQEAVQASPDHAVARLKLGNHYLKRGEFERAAKHFLKAIELQPDLTPARVNLAGIRSRQGRHADAVRHLQQATMTEPGQLEIEVELALALLRAGDSAAAIDPLRRALTRKPDEPRALNNLAWILATHPRAAHRNGEEAVRLAQAACTAGGGKRSAAVLDTLAVAYAEAGRFDEAVRTVVEAIDMARASGEEALVKLLTEHHRLFQSGHPYHEPH